MKSKEFEGALCLFFSVPILVTCKWVGILKCSSFHAPFINSFGFYLIQGGAKETQEANVPERKPFLYFALTLIFTIKKEAVFSIKKTVHSRLCRASSLENNDKTSLLYYCIF